MAVDVNGLESAGIGGAFVLLAGVLPQWLQARSAAKKAAQAAEIGQLVHEALGSRNGHGTLMDQGATLIDTVNAHITQDEERFDSVDASIGKIRTHLGIPADEG